MIPLRAEIREQSRREGKGRTIVRFRNRSFPQFAFSRPELRKCHFLLAAVLSSLSPPSTLLRFPLSPSIVPGPNSVARARARTTFPRNVSSANQREILRGRFKGADVFPKRPRPAAILPREKIYSLSFSLCNRFDLFSMLQIPLRYFLALRLLKRTPQESKYQSKYPKAGKHLYPFVLYTTDLSWNNT